MSVGFSGSTSPACGGWTCDTSNRAEKAAVSVCASRSTESADAGPGWMGNMAMRLGWTGWPALALYSAMVCGPAQAEKSNAIIGIKENKQVVRIVGCRGGAGPLLLQFQLLEDEFIPFLLSQNDFH